MLKTKYIKQTVTNKACASTVTQGDQNRPSQCGEKLKVHKK